MKYFIGVDLGGTNIKAGLLDPSSRVLKSIAAPTEASRGPEYVIDRIIDFSKRLVDEAGVPWKQVAAMGVVSPGLIDPGRGMILATSNLPGWKNVPFRDQIAAKTGLPIVVENDAAGAAYGEYWAGAGAEAEIHHLIMLTLGTGIGGGVVIDGKLLQGNFASTAEFGHIIVAPGGKPCPCGQRGCLELYASASAIVREALVHIQAGEETMLTKYHTHENPITCADVFDAARNNDPVADTIVNAALEHLGQVCVSLTRIFDTQLIVLGGGMTAAGPALFDRMNRIFQELTWRLMPELVKIVPTKLGNNAGFIGAAGLAAELIKVNNGGITRIAP